eukprot:CAMPEP_0180652960 /NCGR_PEP_ID=MMETSP1037_2-20121125/53798_1 /TAXON_ID=632150 /ORGANISM="Azadinium spinosum, Strain 3D9" /LENGTH=33 /DNA_ID= /DNA_START= /DNA_END= /DNA_ORIENTATION=
MTANAPRTTGHAGEASLRCKVNVSKDMPRISVP